MLRALAFISAVLVAGAGVFIWSLDAGSSSESVGQGLCFVAAIIGLGALAWVPNKLGRAQRAALQEIDTAFAARRFVHTLELAARARERWHGWEQADAYVSFALVALWKIDEALAWYEVAWSARLHRQTKRWAVERALFISELAARAGPWRARADELQLPEETMRLAHFVRAAREGDFARVQELHAKLSAVPPVLEPLVAAILAMATDQTAPLDKAILVGETGLEQIEKVWPAFADFIRRAPTK